MSIRASLEKAKANGDVVSIYTSDNWDSYSVGYVKNIDETHVCLESITGLGETIGYEFRSVDEIAKVEISGKYEEKIAILNKHQGKIIKPISLTLSQNNILNDAIAFAHKTQNIITIWASNSSESLTGYVKSIDKEAVTIHVVDEYGSDDGVSIIPKEDIESLDFGTKEEQIREFLHKQKGAQKT